MKLLCRMMLDDGILDQEQLARLLEQHVITALPLEDILIDSEVISEHEYEVYLGRRYKTSVAHRKELNIDRLAVAKLREVIIRRYQVIPLAVHGKALSLAMVNPLQRRALAEVGMATGMIIKPMVITQRTWQSLVDEYCGKPRRYTNTPHKRHYLSDKSPDEALEWFSAQVAKAENAQDVSRPLVAFLGALFKRVVILLERDEQLFGWDGILSDGGDIDLEIIRSIKLPLRLPSVMASVQKSKSPYLGSMGSELGNRLLLQALGGNARQPKTVYVIPLIIGGHVAQVFYLDRGPGKRVPNKLGDVSLAISKATEVYERLIRDAITLHT